ncbi:hypothetical protein HanRHA438_Chr06g0248271 [Helianthus annuus]|nr:hypothetical protein HanRHA438_Chr06g0248271 [Helianthus annuus]
MPLMMETLLGQSRTWLLLPSSTSRYSDKFPFDAKSYTKKHSPLPFEQQNPLSLAKFSCFKEVNKLNPFVNSASSALQLVTLTLFIATTDVSRKTPLYTAENLLLPSKFASEKYQVADSISSMLKLCNESDFGSSSMQKPQVFGDFCVGSHAQE